MVSMQKEEKMLCCRVVSSKRHQKGTTEIIGKLNSKLAEHEKLLSKLDKTEQSWPLQWATATNESMIASDVVICSNIKNRNDALIDFCRPET